MLVTDLGEIAAIEQQSYDFPWSEAIFRDCLRVGYHCIVLDNGVGIDGYAVMAVAAGESHLLNLCVAADRRGRGLGTSMLARLVATASRLNATRMYLEVRPSNHPALQLYRKAGFGPIGVRKDYYQARVGREDAIVLTMLIAASRPPGQVT